MQQPAEALEAEGRRLVRRLVLLVQATLLLEDSPAGVSDAFIGSRFDPEWGGVYGLLPEPAGTPAIIERAWASTQCNL